MYEEVMRKIRPVRMGYLELQWMHNTYFSPQFTRNGNVCRFIFSCICCYFSALVCVDFGFPILISIFPLVEQASHTRDYGVSHVEQASLSSR